LLVLAALLDQTFIHVDQAIVQTNQPLLLLSATGCSAFSSLHDYSALILKTALRWVRLRPAKGSTESTLRYQHLKSEHSKNSSYWLHAASDTVLNDSGRNFGFGKFVGRE
jgi:hypothetical protein